MSEENIFYIKVLGRTIEHLGVQMYKRREAAIAELVANSWDSGATKVTIELPDESSYDKQTAAIVIGDNGAGMSTGEIQDHYLVVGRNKREDADEKAGTRLPMGRKGIGKLAGFGIASHMKVTTWKDAVCTEFEMNAEQLKATDGTVQDIPIPHKPVVLPEGSSASGTKITLSGLKHSTPLVAESLRESLARIFSLTVRTQMPIEVNGVPVGDPAYEWESRFPSDGSMHEEVLSDGGVVRYWYGFSEKVIKLSELRGFNVQVRGKTAQASPFFFNVEATASGQHGTRYLTGVIEADYLDEGTDSESDIVSTDRQEIDWQSDKARPLMEWGQALTRKLLRDWSERNSQQFFDWILTHSEVRSRIEALDRNSQKQVEHLLKVLGKAEHDKDRALELTDGLIKVYEYQRFHDVIGELEAVGEDPAELEKLLARLQDWKVLESRAILEVIKGRIAIIEKFHAMVVNDVRETAHAVGDENMHDLIAGYPWLLDPDWQVLSEEKTITKQLQEWNAADTADEADRSRYDFLALTDERRLVVIEIKRSGHPVTLGDLQRLDGYKEKLAAGASKELSAVMVYGGVVDIKDSGLKNSFETRADLKLLKWGEVYERTNRYYGHYRAVLEGDIVHTDFAAKEREVAQTRKVLDSGTTYRAKEDRAAGIGPQDVTFEKKDDQEVAK